MVGTEGFCSSLVGNICSAQIVRPLAHSIACGGTRQQWLTLAEAGITK
jgi:hypothetical protein